MEINGGEVIGMTYADERQFLSRYERFLLTHHHTRHFYHLFDAMVRVNPDLQKMLDFIHKNISERWVKNIRGKVLNDLMVRYLYFSLHPQQFAFKGFLVLYANYFYIQQYLQRIACVLVNEYGFESRYYGFKINKEKLFKLSQMWAKDMLPLVEEKIVPKYKEYHDPEYQKLSQGQKIALGRWRNHKKQTKEELYAKQRERYRKNKAKKTGKKVIPIKKYRTAEEEAELKAERLAKRREHNRLVRSGELDAPLW